MSAATTVTDYRALLARQDWAALQKKLKVYAWKATGSRSMERAEDLAQDTIARLWEDAGVRWEPATEPNLFRFLTGLLRGELSNELRLKSTSSEISTDRQTIEAHGDGGKGSAEHLLMHAETLHTRLAALREGFAADAVATVVLQLYGRGIGGAAEQVAASGASPYDIRLARERVFKRAEAIARESEEVP